MNGRERLRRIMRFESVDRLPHWELCPWGQTYDRWLREGLKKDALKNPFNWFEGEPAWNLDRRAFAAIDSGVCPPFDYEVIEEDERYIVSRGGEGITTRALKEGTVLGTRMTMDQYIDFAIKDKASWDDFKWRLNPDSPSRYPFWWDELARLWKDREYPACLLQNGTFGLYGRLRAWIGTEGLSFMFYDQPELVEEILDYYTDFLIRLVTPAVHDVQFDYFNFFEDMAGKGGPLISPQLFRKYLMPRYKRIIEFLKGNGVEYVWMDSDGDMRALIPLLIECGVDVLWPLEAASDMDPVVLHKQYGKDLRFCGGLDKRELAKSHKHIDDELAAKILPLRDCGGYIPHVDHAIDPDISYDNWLYYLETKQKMLHMD
jgi:uroporphyrinogen decarboxylase